MLRSRATLGSTVSTVSWVGLLMVTHPNAPCV
jgi:hypothetical protein